MRLRSHERSLACACARVFAPVCLRPCIRAPQHACVREKVRARVTCVRVCASACVRARVCERVCACACVRARVCVRVCACAPPWVGRSRNRDSVKIIARNAVELNALTVGVTFWVTFRLRLGLGPGSDQSCRSGLTLSLFDQCARAAADSQMKTISTLAASNEVHDLEAPFTRSHVPSNKCACIPQTI
eukprot:6194640-Pleurochrysis_carterae.AAC.1